jgi:stage V sporulation protein B
MLPSLTTSVALSAVPSLSAALQRGEAGRAEVKKTATTALGLTLTLAIPAALGLSVYAEEVLLLLFGGQPAAAAQAASWLSCLALSVPAACLVTVTGAMLQSCGRASRPVCSMLIGVLAKTVLAYMLLGMDGFGMMGAPISSLVCDTVIVTVNFIFIARYAPDMLPDRRTGATLLLLPTALSALAVWVVEMARPALTGGQITPLVTLATITAVAILYGGCALIAAVACRRKIPICKT